MTEKEVSTNQTQFSFEEPIFENAAVYTEKKPDLEEPLPKPKSKKKLIIALLIFFLFVLLLLSLLIAGKKKPELDIVEEIAPPEVIQKLGPMQKRIEDARELLELADPAKQDLAFPPVDLKMRLDPKEK